MNNESRSRQNSGKYPTPSPLEGGPLSRESNIDQQSDATAAQQEGLLEGYLVELESNSSISPEQFLNQHARDLPESTHGKLLQLLRSLQLVYAAGKHLTPPASIELMGGGNSLGDFQILRALGRGGMGVVFLAKQISLDRTVALKMLFSSGIPEPSMRARFQLEARAAATLHHPNIVPVYAIGQEQEVDFFAMQYIEGHSLHDELRGVSNDDSSFRLVSPIRTTVENRGRSTEVDEIDRTLDFRRANKAIEPRRALRIAERVADALAHAHRSGIVHRDVKPSNVLLDAQDQPWLVDFGLAQIAAGPDITAPGAVLGTLRYMSPEQLDPAHRVVDQRTDIYSLGATLYEMLAGQPAFEGGSREEIARLIAEGKIPALRSICPNIPHDVATVVHKALESEAANRYASAGELAADLQACLDQRPIRAKPPTLADRVGKWSRRNRSLVRLGLVSLFVSIAGLSLAVWLVNDARQREMLARKSESQRAESERQAKLDAEQQKAKALKHARSEREARERVEEERRFAQAINEFVRDDFLALTSVEGQTRNDDYRMYPLSRNTTLRDLLDRAAQKLEKREDLSPRARASLYSIMGTNYRGLGDFSRSLELLEKSEQIFKSNFGPADEETLAATISLAVTLRDAGQYQEAIQLLEKTRSIAESERGPASASTLAILERLAGVYELSGQPGRAIDLLNSIIQARESCPDSNPADRLQNLTSLASAHLQIGNKQQSEQLFKRLDELVEQERTLDPISRLGYQKEKAGFLMKAGKTQEGIELLRKGITAAQEVYGTDHPYTLTFKNDLAAALGATGVLDESLSLQQECVEGFKSTVGTDHPNTLIAINTLAVNYLNRGRFAEARTLLEPAWEEMKTVLGAEHPNTLTTGSNLAGAYWSLGMPEKALPILQSALEAKETKLGPENPDTLLAKLELAKCMLMSKRSKDALPILKDLTLLTPEILGPEHPGTLVCMNTLAVCYLNLRQSKKAVPILEQVLDLMLKAHGEKHPNTLSTMASLGTACLEAENWDRAIEMLEQARQAQQVLLGPGHPESIATARDLALALGIKKRHQEAVEMLEKMVTHSEIANGRGHATTQKMVVYLALAYQNQGKLEGAIELLEEAAKTFPNPELSYRASLRDVLMRAGKRDRFAELLKQDLQQTKSNHEPDSKRFAYEAVILGTDCLYLEEYVEAERLLRQALQVLEADPLDAWRAAEARSALGAALMGQGRDAEGLDLIESGYQQLKEHRFAVPVKARFGRFRDALDRLIAIHARLEHKDEVEKWQNERNKWE